MGKDDISLLLSQAGPGQHVSVGKSTLISVFGSAFMPAAAAFAREHDATFQLNVEGDGVFLRNEIRTRQSRDIPRFLKG
jgi:hypothetical protein